VWIGFIYIEVKDIRVGSGRSGGSEDVNPFEKSV